MMFPVLCQAKTHYVSGVREIMVRTGPSIENRIIARLETGNEVTLIREEGSYALVALADGRRGYVLKNYLTNTVPAEYRLQELEAEVEKQQHDLAQLRQENDRLKTASTQARDEVVTQTELLRQLQTERAELQQDNRVSWFLSGAGVLLIGWLLGWTRVRLRRKAYRQGLNF